MSLVQAWILELQPHQTQVIRRLLRLQGAWMYSGIRPRPGTKTYNQVDVVVSPVDTIIGTHESKWQRIATPALPPLTALPRSPVGVTGMPDPDFLRVDPNLKCARWRWLTSTKARLAASSDVTLDRDTQDVFGSSSRRVVFPVMSYHSTRTPSQLERPQVALRRLSGISTGLKSRQRQPELFGDT